MPKETKIRLIERIPRTPTIESFRFIPEHKIDFLPGQFLELRFSPQDPRDRSLNKYLSFSSSPTREYIEVTKRLSSSSFSQRLRSLKTDDEVTISAPLGGVVFTPHYKKIGFFIGGIGITPAISIMEYIYETGLDTDVLLIYSNRTPEEIAFKDILDIWKAHNKNFTIIYTLTDCQPEDSTCLSGRIDKDMILRQAADYPDRIIYLVGPPAMVKTMQEVCNDIGCAEHNLKIENFIGY
ncbi:MAG: FAD-dependent oxidoreductase [Candidatus Omnitrophica bacterium]|nr:FAD-dependent oxidoreductase [Candidatus Omnitrophota bacterium]